MKRNLSAAVAFFATIVVPCIRSARADDPTTDPAPSSQPDKSQYTLFNPTPKDQLRGMSTDRPNVTNTPQTIDAGHLQIEVGAIDYSYYRDRYQGADADLQSYDFGQFNFRLGVLNNLELNAVVDAYDFNRDHDEPTGINTDAGGFGDTTIGGKLNLWGNEIGDQPWATAMAIQPQFKFPTARSDIDNGRFEFSVAAPLLINLPAGFHLSTQPGISYERSVQNTGYVTGIENTLCLDRVFWKNLDLYIEYASDLTTESHAKAVQTLDLGGIYALTDNIALDTGIAIGLNNASPNVEVLAGISIRF